VTNCLATEFLTNHLDRRLRWFRYADTQLPVSARRTLLAEIHYDQQHYRNPTDPRQITIGLKPLGDTPCWEIWSLPYETHTGWHDNIGYVSGGDFLFAHLFIEATQKDHFEAITENAYTRLLGLIRQAGYPYILRVWNYIAAIHSQQADGINRYQAFCIGRANAFEAAAFTVHDFPAATTIGCHADGLSIHLLASRRPGQTIENQRQLSAYHYPTCYSPRSPAFARAIRYCGPETVELSISGTSSVVGHSSMHPGYPLRQTRETLRNLATIIHAAGLHDQSRPWAQPGLLKIFLRDTTCLPAIDRVLRRWTQHQAQLLYLQGINCRAELDIEIEGHCTVTRDPGPIGQPTLG
jgi:chorismate lyase/3-hydroxybenzoate synthase